MATFIMCCGVATGGYNNNLQLLSCPVIMVRFYIHVSFPCLSLSLVVERASVTVGEPTSYDSTFGDLGRVLTADISKVFQQTGIPTGKRGEG